MSRPSRGAVSRRRVPVGPPRSRAVAARMARPRCASFGRKGQPVAPLACPAPGAHLLGRRSRPLPALVTRSRILISRDHPTQVLRSTIHTTFWELVLPHTPHIGGDLGFAAGHKEAGLP